MERKSRFVDDSCHLTNSNQNAAFPAQAMKEKYIL